MRKATPWKILLSVSEIIQLRDDVHVSCVRRKRYHETFGDDPMPAAVIDRLVHHGHLLMFGTKSCRMAHALMRHQSPTTGEGRKESLWKELGHDGTP